MNSSNNFTYLAVLFLFGIKTVAQNPAKPDSLGLPGDNLNLYAVMDAFRESETLEKFEKKINDKEAQINNLDLNNDEKTDYIKVNDHKEGNAHLIVLQTDVTEKEKQDIAVISVEKDDNGKVKVQIIGDPELYGKDYIIEPNDEAAGKKAPGNPPVSTTKKSDTTVTAEGKTVIINNTTNNYYSTSNDNQPSDNYQPVPPVHQWVIVQYVYAPAYVPYYSPWYWGYYPPYWNPWTPFFWHQYYWHHHHYWNHLHYYYNYGGFYYGKNYATHYAPRRSVSSNFIERKSKGSFGKTYSRPDLGKPPLGRPNPGYQGPSKNPPPVKQGINPKPQGNFPPKQPMGRPPGGMNKPPKQNMGPKPGGGAPIQRSGGGGVNKGR